MTVMLPAAAPPRTQLYSLNGVQPTTPQPWTTTVSAIGAAGGLQS